MIKKNEKIFLAGHNGLVGSAILRMLKQKKYSNILTVDRKKLDLFNQKKVFKFLKQKKPKVVIIAAARVGGIRANNEYRGEFIRENLIIQENLIHGSFLAGIKKMIFLGSSCVYPKNCKQPIKENYLLTGELEKTNEPYAIAKIAGIKMCESYNQQYKTNYICLMPTNTFGPGDNYNSFSSHFIPAIIKKIYQSKLKKKPHIKLWGTGLSKREVIYVDDLANAIIYFMDKKVKHSLINIGTSKDRSIKDYAQLIIKITGANLKVKFDNNKKLDGVKRKVLDTSLATMYGWKPKIKLEDAILKTFNDLKKNFNKVRH